MEGLAHYDKEIRPWGDFERFTLNEPTTVKVLTVKTDQSLSLQTHKGRDEFWHILQGSGVVQIGNNEHPAVAGDDFYIHKETPHRIKSGADGLTFLEIAFGLFNEHDEVRLEDTYGRQ